MSGQLRFLDTNILLRYFVGEPAEQAARAHRLLQRVERGEERVVTSVMILFETVFTLQRTYKIPKNDIRAGLEAVLVLPAIRLPDKVPFLRALALYAASPGLSFADAYTVIEMEDQGIREVYSFGRDFDRVPGVVRIEPREDD